MLSFNVSLYLKRRQGSAQSLFVRASECVSIRESNTLYAQPWLYVLVLAESFEIAILNSTFEL